MSSAWERLLKYVKINIKYKKNKYITFQQKNFSSLKINFLKQITSQNWEKIFAKHILTKENMYNSIIRRYSTQFLKRTKCLNRHFPKEGIWMANKHFYSAQKSLVTREMQMKSQAPSHKNGQT